MNLMLTVFPVFKSSPFYEWQETVLHLNELPGKYSISTCFHLF